MALLLGLSLTSCKDDKDEPAPPAPQIPELKVGASELLFNAEGNSSQNVNITCNNAWTASVNDNWIDLSPKSGDGNGTLLITVSSTNASSKERSATIRIVSGELTREITVTQKASLVADCTAIPTGIVTLSDQFAFDIEWGKNVSYFQFIVFEEKDAQRMSDAEIIEALADNRRYIEDDGYFYYCATLDGENYLSPTTNYVIYTLAHDKNGKVVDLIKTKVTTRDNKNQAAAYVSDLRWDEPYWKYTTTINPYASEYYILQLTGETSDDCLVWDYDIVYAYLLQSKVNRYTPAIQTGAWRMIPDNSPYVLIATWAKDKKAEWAGIMEHDWSNSNWYSSNTPAMRSNKKQRHSKIENGCRNIHDFKNFTILRQY